MPCPRPSQVGFSDISAVTWVRAKTKTRSKKSSSGATRLSAPSVSTGAVSATVIECASTKAGA